jgi:hypothetical protein
MEKYNALDTETIAGGNTPIRMDSVGRMECIYNYNKTETNNKK